MKTNKSKFLAVVLAICTCGCAKFPLNSDIAIRNELTSPESPAKDLSLRFGMARMTERNGSLAEAKKAYEEILLGYPGHVESMHRLAVVLTKQDRVAGALRQFEDAIIASQRPSAELLGDYGYAQYLAGKYSEAERNTVAALDSEPNNKRYVNNLALIIGAQGDLGKSRQLFRTIHSEAETMSNIAYVQSLQGNLENAKRSYHRALEAKPNLSVAANGLLELHQVPARQYNVEPNVNEHVAQANPAQPYQGYVENPRLDRAPVSVTQNAQVSGADQRILDRQIVRQLEQNPVEARRESMVQPVSHIEEIDERPSRVNPTGPKVVEFKTTNNQLMQDLDSVESVSVERSTLPTKAAKLQASAPTGVAGNILIDQDPPPFEPASGRMPESSSLSQLESRMPPVMAKVDESRSPEKKTVKPFIASIESSPRSRTGSSSRAKYTAPAVINVKRSRDPGGQSNVSGRRQSVKVEAGKPGSNPTPATNQQADSAQASNSRRVNAVAQPKRKLSLDYASAPDGGSSSDDSTPASSVSNPASTAEAISGVTNSWEMDSWETIPGTSRRRRQ